MEISSRQFLNWARALAAGVWFGAGPMLRHPTGAALAGLWLYPTLRRNCAWHGPVITRFRTQERAVWLTIDDGPERRCTPAMLDLLDEHAVKSSFFVVGCRVDAHRDLCREILSRGHTIENHTQSHPSASWWLLPPDKIHQEINACTHAIRTACGQHPRFFRSPVGMNGPWVHPAASEAGLEVVGWSAAGGDGCRTPPSVVADRIMHSIFPGAIVLLHSGSRVRQRLLTLKMLLERLREASYTCVLPGLEEF